MDAREREAFMAYASLPKFQRRVDQALETIREALAIAKAEVAVSWGKDSVVTLHLCQTIDPAVASMSFGHSDRLLISNYAEVEASYHAKFGGKTVTIQVEGYDVPLKVSQLKRWEQSPMVIMGLRKEESSKRSIALTKYGLIHAYSSGDREGSWRACPIGYWSWQDVWAYTALHGLPYLNIYDQLPRDRGRTTDHLSRTTSKAWQQRRFEELKFAAPEYATFLKTNHREMFE